MCVWFCVFMFLRVCVCMKPGMCVRLLIRAPSRAAMLSSPLSDESELQELRESGNRGYADTAKMIESTSGRFEIGDDDIDDPEL